MNQKNDNYSYQSVKERVTDKLTAVIRIQLTESDSNIKQVPYCYTSYRSRITLPEDTEVFKQFIADHDGEITPNKIGHIHQSNMRDITITCGFSWFGIMIHMAESLQECDEWAKKLDPYIK